MPKGVYENPIERAAKISEAQKRGAYFNCLICSSKFWRKPCEIKKGDNKFCSKECYYIWQKKRKRSMEFRDKCKKGQIKRYTGKIRIKPINLRIRNSAEFREWRQKVFIRDNWTCQKCGKRSKKNDYIRIEAHHIKPFAIFPDLRFVIDNGLTLCKKCHDKEPKGKEILCLK